MGKQGQKWDPAVERRFSEDMGNDDFVQSQKSEKKKDNRPLAILSVQLNVLA